MSNIFLIFVDMSKHLKYSQSERKNLNTQLTVTEKWELAAGIILVDSPTALVFMQSFTAFHCLSHFQSFFPLSTLSLSLRDVRMRLLRMFAEHP